MAPYFITTPSNSTALLHATIRLDCQAYGVPAPTLKWVKYTVSGKTVIQTGGRFIVGVVFKNLYILGIHWSDAGRYGCIAQNQYGRLVADAYVTVVTGMLDIIKYKWRIVQITFKFTVVIVILYLTLSGP